MYCAIIIFFLILLFMFNSKPTIQNCRNLTPEITDKLDVKSQFNSVSLLLKKIVALISKDNADDCRPNCTNNFFKLISLKHTC